MELLIVEQPSEIRRDNAEREAQRQAKKNKTAEGGIVSRFGFNNQYMTGYVANSLVPFTLQLSHELAYCSYSMGWIII